jgi:hypothetical protein
VKRRQSKGDKSTKPTGGAGGVREDGRRAASGHRTGRARRNRPHDGGAYHLPLVNADRRSPRDGRSGWEESLRPRRSGASTSSPAMAVPGRRHADHGRAAISQPSHRMGPYTLRAVVASSNQSPFAQQSRPIEALSRLALAPWRVGGVAAPAKM